MYRSPNAAVTQSCCKSIRNESARVLCEPLSVSAEPLRNVRGIVPRLFTFAFCLGRHALPGLEEALPSARIEERYAGI